MIDTIDRAVSGLAGLGCFAVGLRVLWDWRAPELVPLLFGGLLVVAGIAFVLDAADAARVR